MYLINRPSFQLSSLRVKTFIKNRIHDGKLWGILFIVLFLISGILTLHNYGLTWDEGLGNLFFGERYLHYFTTFNQKYLDFKADLGSLRQYQLHLFLSPFRGSPNEFPAFADTLSAGTMYLFSYGLKWLNPIDGFHLFTVLLSAIFLWVTYRFAEPRLGKFAALMSILFLGTFPRFWADMHFNVKDVPETIFFGMVLMAYWVWYEKPTWRAAVVVGFLMGCALGVKANSIFIVPILLLSVIPWSIHIQAWKDIYIHLKKYILHYIIIGISSISTYLLSWPYLYTDTFHRLKSYWSYIYSQGGRNNGNFWSIDPLRQALTTIPEFMLIAFGIGFCLIAYQIWRDKSPFWRLLLLWAVIPVLRVSIPGAINFDGIRHFLEFVPAVALIAGYGVSRMATLVANNWHLSSLAVKISILILLVANLVQINLKYYPYQYLYYNEFTGGLAGARDRFLGTEATDYWASSYRQGITWLNENAPANSSVRALIAPWIVDISAPVLLRANIHPITGLPDFSVMRQSQDPYYLMFILRAGGDAQDEINYTQRHAKLVYQIIVDQVPIMEIYKFGGS